MGILISNINIGYWLWSPIHQIKTHLLMDLCLLLCGFWVDLRKLHGLMVEQGSLRSCDSLGGAWEVWFERDEAYSSWRWKFRKIKSLILRSLRQRVRMTQIWQHFTNELILLKHEVGSFFSLRRTGNGRDKRWEILNLKVWKLAPIVAHMTSVTRCVSCDALRPKMTGLS